jgi:hypothetical protein
MSLSRGSRAGALALAAVFAALPGGARPQPDVERLVAAIAGQTPLDVDLRSLTDEIGGRATGSDANVRAVEWGVARFKAAGVDAHSEPFTMPERWLEKDATARVTGDVSFTPRVAAMPFAAATGPDGVRAPLVDGGAGGEADFARLGAAARGAFVVIETGELVDLDGLFREYIEGHAAEERAAAAGVAGVVFMSSRPRNLLYRHNADSDTPARRPMVIMEREAAGRVLRLLRQGKKLELTLVLDLERGAAYEARNVIGEIRGAERPDEVVILGAHLDSWDLGTGALDNGCNVALLIDVARQMRALGRPPRRTVRFALWNGEEQGLHGSWGYVKARRAEMEKHVLAASFDIGSGRITGFFTAGRPEIGAFVDRALVPVQSLGPFQQVPAAILGTDHYDFMMEGVATLVANQEPANYGPNYHARSDTFDKVDLLQLRKNAAIAAAVAWAFANEDVTWKRHGAAEVARLVETAGLKPQMESMGLWLPWVRGERGLRPKP